jgi:hypothetical protein
MSCRGVHLALDDDDVAALRAVDEDERADYATEILEEKFATAYKSRYQQSDKAWDAMHRALTDGELEWDNGSYPLNHVIMGGEVMYPEDDYLISLKTPAQVREIAAALREVGRERLRAGYDRIDRNSYGCPKSDEDFDYTWTWFAGVAAFYQRAAEAGSWVLFMADQ